MKKNYFYLILLLLSCSFVVAQKVTLTPLIVNGKSVTSTSPINLESRITSNVSLSVKIESPVSVGSEGTIAVYFTKDAAITPKVVLGGPERTTSFIQSRTSISNFEIILNLNDFNSTGGYIFAQYKSNSGLTYKSSNVSVSKNGVTTPPDPSTPPFFPIQSIPYGATPLLPQYDNHDVKSTEWIINDVTPLAGTLNNYKLYTPGPNSLKQMITKHDGNRVPYTDKRVAVRVLNFLPKYLLNNLYVDNKISQNQYLINGETPEPIIGNQASESHTETVPGTTRPKTVTNFLTNYQWQARIKFPMFWYDFNLQYFNEYDWKDIPGATQKDYTPPTTNIGMEYRRSIIENPLTDIYPETRRSSTSNVINVIPLFSDQSKNILCCDQVVNATNPAIPITGDQPFHFLSYQWEISEDNINWREIFEANQKNFTPKMLYKHRDSHDSQQLFFRRIVFNITDNKYYLSNTIKVIFENPSTLANGTIKIYPIPTTSILNVEAVTTSTITDITIINQLGYKIIPQSNSIINSYSNKLDVSNLPVGIYSITINTKLEGATRSYPIYAKFIKQ